MIGYISRPGTSSGPCDLECRHEDCLEQKSRASVTCRECRADIGYDTSFKEVMIGDKQHLIHARCLERGKA